MRDEVLNRGWLRKPCSLFLLIAIPLVVQNAYFVVQHVPTVERPSFYISHLHASVRKT